MGAKASNNDPGWYIDEVEVVTGHGAVAIDRAGNEERTLRMKGHAKHAQVLLTTDEPWTETTDRGIEILAGKINWLEERLCAWEAKRKAREAV